MKITDLLVTAEDCQTGKRILGYVCGCKSCATPFEHENVDRYFPNIYNCKDEWLGAPIGKIKQYKDITYDFWTFYRIS